MSVRVLFVDDEDIEISLAERYIGVHDDIELTTCKSPEDAVNLIESQNFDVIICDYMMEQVDGLEILEVVRHISEDIPFVVFTGKSHEDVAIKALNLGANFYVIKEGAPKQRFSELLQIIRSEHTKMKSRKVIEKSEKRYRMLLASIREMIFVHDEFDRYSQVHVIDTSDLYNMATGPFSSVEELIGKHVSDSLPNDVAEKIIEQSKVVRATGRDCDVEYTLELDGTKRHYEASLSLHEDGKSIVRVVRDITPRKRMEDALRWELQVNRVMAELAEKLNTPDITLEEIAVNVLNYCKLLTNSEHGYVSFTDPITGDLVGHTLTEMMSDKCSVSTEDTKSVFRKGTDGRYPYLWGHALNTFQSFYSNDPGNHPSSGGVPDGHLKLRNFMSAPAVFGERLMGQIALANCPAGFTEKELEAIERIADMYVLFLHRTEVDSVLRANERKFRELFSVIPDPAFVWKRNNQAEIILEMANRAADRLAKRGTRQILGKTVEEIYLARSELADIIRDAMDDKAPDRLEMHYHSRMLDEEIWSIWNFSKPSEDTLLMVTTDITDIKRSQRILRQQKEELSDFAHQISHDLKGSLHNILGYIDLLEDEFEQDYIDGVRRLVSRMERLITKSVSLADSGLIIGKLEIIEPRAVISSVAVQVIPDSIEYSVEEIPQIQCDRVKFEQVVYNLLVNAVKHGQPSQILVTSEETDDSITICFANDGEPIPDDARDDLLSSAISKKRGGGRGLSIVKRIVEAHGWTIELLDDGLTTFKLTIPLRKHK